MKKLLMVLAAAVLVLGLAGVSQASIVVMDFEPTAFTPDTAVGDHAHVYSTPYGDVNFNGRIWKKLGGTVIGVPPKSYFWKNTTGSSGKDEITIEFGFPVYSIDVDIFGFKSDVPNYAVKIYDVNGVLVLDDTFTGIGTWEHINELYSPDPVKTFVLSSLSGNGNNLALDNITVGTVPEPASLVLLGSGLLGLFGMKKKRS